MYRESRVNRSWLPPSYTSTKNRAVLCAPSYHGSTAKVDGSGSITMSDSWISLNPLIEEPSSLPTPRLNSSGPSDVDGIVMCWSAPSTSTNWRSIHRIPSVSIRLSTDAMVIFFDFAGLLAEIAIAFPPGRSHRSVCCLGRNLNIYKLFRGEIVRMAGILIRDETMFDGPLSPSYTSSTATVGRGDSDGGTDDLGRTRCQDPAAVECGRTQIVSRHREGNRCEHQHRLEPGPKARGPRGHHGIRQRGEGGATRPSLGRTAGPRGSSRRRLSRPACPGTARSAGPRGPSSCSSSPRSRPAARGRRTASRSSCSR